ncbi:hypothetical protein BGX38DRAFT_1237591 [Terfezia claveryi]|nr:hypothetical protein BGX38DRAFT_1237591 [Terfezia claveryi]
MMGLASNNQLEQLEGGNTALVASNNYRNNNNKRKSSRTTEHKTSESTKMCSYCQKHGGNPSGHIWQECRKLKREQQRKKEKVVSQTPPPYQQNSSNQQGSLNHALISTDLSHQMNIDQPDVSTISYTWKLHQQKKFCVRTHFLRFLRPMRHNNLFTFFASDARPDTTADTNLCQDVSTIFIPSHALQFSAYLYTPPHIAS